MAAEQYIGLGDLAGLPHKAVIDHINVLHARTLAARRHPDHISRVESMQTEAERQLLDGLDAYRESLEARGAKTRLMLVANKIANADETSRNLGETDPISRAARRRRMFTRTEIDTDIDGTVTDLQYGDYLLPNIPTSIFGEQALSQRGRDAFARVYVENWQDYVRNYPGLFEDAAKSTDVVIREGVREFGQYAREQGWDMRVISANFKPFVTGVLEKAGLKISPGKIHAIEADSIVATEKSLIIKAAAQEDPDVARFYVGDGSSDLEAVKAKSVVIGYFALEGSSFAKQLEDLSRKDSSIVYFTYRTYTDIQLKLAQIHDLSSEQAA